jgi:hypothetical protein
MTNLSDNIDQAQKYWCEVVKGGHWDPVSRRCSFTPSGTGGGDDPSGSSGGLSQRALDRIAVIQDAKNRGLLSHDAAEAEILQIIREES